MICVEVFRYSERELARNERASEWAGGEMKTNNTFILNTIFFETGKWYLLVRALAFNHSGVRDLVLETTNGIFNTPRIQIVEKFSSIIICIKSGWCSNYLLHSKKIHNIFPDTATVFNLQYLSVCCITTKTIHKW